MSTFEANIELLSERGREHQDQIQTEEAAKTSIVMPFLQTLGYDVFNPSEVIPEFTADTYSRKGEKVDYAVKLDGAIQILIECKGLNSELSEKHLGQLFRYFSVTDARFAVLTNGREYRFYSDLEESNKLDRRPFFVFDLFDYSPDALEKVKEFRRENFSVENILEHAERMKYVSLVRKVLSTWLEAPSDPFVRAMASEVHEGRLNSHVRVNIEAAIPQAFRQIMRDQMRARFSSVLEDGYDDKAEPVAETDAGSEIITTQEEIEGWLTVRSILSKDMNPERVVMRDAKSYCAIILDNNNRKPLVRLHFNRKQKYVGLFDGEKEERIPIAGCSELFVYTDRIRETAEKYEQ